jgi:hypothetical protein
MEIEGYHSSYFLRIIMLRFISTYYSGIPAACESRFYPLLGNYNDYFLVGTHSNQIYVFKVENMLILLLLIFYIFDISIDSCGIFFFFFWFGSRMYKYPSVSLDNRVFYFRNKQMPILKMNNYQALNTKPMLVILFLLLHSLIDENSLS